MKKSADIKPPLTGKSAFNRAMIFHITLAVLLVISIINTPKSMPPQGLNLKQADKIVQATTISSQQVQQEVKQLQDQQTEAQNEQAAKLAAMQKAAADALAAKQQQQAQLAALKAQQLALQQQAAQQLAALKQQQADATKQLAQTKAAAAKAQQQAKLQQAAKLDLAKQLSTQSTQLDKQQNQQMNDQISQYTALILQAISQQWLIPANADPTSFCILEIKLGDGGVVQSVNLQKSSGNPQLDSSAIAAVYNASPLPVPSDPQVFAKMQDINLKVRPADVQT